MRGMERPIASNGGWAKLDYLLAPPQHRTSPMTIIGELMVDWLALPREPQPAQHRPHGQPANEDREGNDDVGHRKDEFANVVVLRLLGVNVVARTPTVASRAMIVVCRLRSSRLTEVVPIPRTGQSLNLSG